MTPELREKIRKIGTCGTHVYMQDDVFGWALTCDACLDRVIECVAEHFAEEIIKERSYSHWSDEAKKAFALAVKWITGKEPT